jgi:hypothetical protein
MKAICAGLFLLLIVLPNTASTQSTDSSSYFPLGLWGIWIDDRTVPFTTDFNIDQWGREKSNWSTINANYLVYWTPYWVQDSVMAFADANNYRTDIANWRYWYTSRPQPTNSLYSWMVDYSLSDSALVPPIIDSLKTTWQSHAGFYNYTFGQEWLEVLSNWPKIEFVSRKIHELDPQRKSYWISGGAPPSGFANATPHLDILQLDAYELSEHRGSGLSGEQEAFNVLLGHYTSTMNYLRGKHTEWQVIIQAHREYRTSDLSLRRPQYNELRAQAYLGLSRGARGVTSYVYGTKLSGSSPSPFVPKSEESGPPNDGLLHGGYTAAVGDAVGIVDPDRIGYDGFSDPDGIDAFANVATLNAELAPLGPTIRKLRLYDAFPSTSIPSGNAASINAVTGNYIEIGVFKRFDQGLDSTSYFMLVNRVCNDASGNTTDPQAVSVSFAHPTYQWLKITEVVSGSQWVIAGTGSGATFTDNLGPGAGKLYRMEQADLSTLAAFNTSASATATANSNQRKLYLESSGKLHEVFESGGAVFYRNTTDGGTTWDVTFQLSSGIEDNSAPAISVTATAIVATWQYCDGEEGFTIYFSTSTDGGQSWSSASSRAGHIEAPDPGPIPCIAGYSEGYLALAYQRSSGLTMQVSTNTGGTWSSLTVPGSGSGYNSPGCAISSTYWSTKQAILAYASDVPSGSPSILWNYYDYQTSSWGTPINLTSIVPGQYAHHANPTLAISATEASGNKYMHAAWDAEDTYYPGTRVIIHRKGNFRSFYNEYSILQYQSQNKPSISGLSDDAAWVVYQNNSGSGVWKMNYDGSYWDGYYGTYVSDGYNPQISVGHTEARYLWTQGTSAPYEIELGAGALSKPGGWHYARAINVITSGTASSITLTLNAIRLLHKGGLSEEVSFDFHPMDSTALTYATAMSQMQSAIFSVGDDVDSMVVEYSIAGINSDVFRGQKALQAQIYFVDQATMLQTSLIPKSCTTENLIIDGRTNRAISFPIPPTLRNKASSIRVGIDGLTDTSSLIYSIGHIYLYTGTSGSFKEGGVQTRSQASLPTAYALEQNYPNPFNPSTRLDFALPKDGVVSLKVYDILGRTIAALIDGPYAAGRHTTMWTPGPNVSSGVYFVRLAVFSEIGQIAYATTQRVLLQK